MVEVSQGSRNPLNLHNSALIRPLEELLHKKCSTLWGALDSSTPRVPGVFWMVVFEGWSLLRKSEKSWKIGNKCLLKAWKKRKFWKNANWRPFGGEYRRTGRPWRAVRRDGLAAAPPRRGRVGDVVLPGHQHHQVREAVRGLRFFLFFSYLFSYSFMRSLTFSNLLTLSHTFSHFIKLSHVLRSILFRTCSHIL